MSILQPPFPCSPPWFPGLHDRGSDRTGCKLETVCKSVNRYLPEPVPGALGWCEAALGETGPVPGLERPAVRQLLRGTALYKERAVLTSSHAEGRRAQGAREPTLWVSVFMFSPR